MAKGTKSHGQIRTKRRSRRSKPQAQIGANQRSNRTEPVYEPDVNAQSLSVADARALLGVSVSTVKRMCRDGDLAWFRTRGPHGHIRVLADSVEKTRKSGAGSKASSGLIATQRETADALRAEIEERKLKRELRRLDEEDSEVERRREAADRSECRTPA